jgi:hypothetical protein
MPLQAGSRLGPYEILAPIGAGGMGEVYSARDTRLGRYVALKVLPSAFSSDPGRVRRFEQEGRTAAALNHPNIVVLYDAGLQDGIYYVATELLEGETLRQRLAGAVLPVRKAIDYGVQIARGLATARLCRLRRQVHHFGQGGPAGAGAKGGTSRGRMGVTAFNHLLQAIGGRVSSRTEKMVNEQANAGHVPQPGYEFVGTLVLA